MELSLNYLTKHGGGFLANEANVEHVRLVCLLHETRSEKRFPDCVCCFSDHGNYMYLWNILRVFPGYGRHFHRGICLALAGSVGLFTRTVYLPVSALIPTRFLYVMISSFAASAYGELMARKRVVPAVYFSIHYSIDSGRSVSLCSPCNDRHISARENGLNVLIALQKLNIGMIEED